MVLACAPLGTLALLAGCDGRFVHVPRSSRLSVLWTHDRRRDRQWIRPDEVTVREQHHPGVSYPADGIWLLARLQDSRLNVVLCPRLTLEMFRDSGRNGSDPTTWLSQSLKEINIGSKGRTARKLKTLVQCLRLSVVCDQLNAPNLRCLKEIARRVFQLVEAYVSKENGKPNWNSVRWFISVHSSSNVVPLSTKSLALRKAKEGVETENLRLCTIKNRACL